MNGRRALSLGVIVALAIAIWVAVQSGDDPAPTSTTASTVAPTTQPPATTATTTPSTTSTTAPSTTANTPPPTTGIGEARIGEVRDLLQELWHGWFLALHLKDEDLVREVVATEQGLADFRTAIESQTFQEPALDDIVIRDVQVLRDDNDCLVVYSTLDLTGLHGEGATTSGVDVLWPHEGGWRRAARWSKPTDLWEMDCESERESELP